MAGSGRDAGFSLMSLLFASATWRLVELGGASFVPPLVPRVGAVGCWGAPPIGLGAAAPTSSCPYKIATTSYSFQPYTSPQFRLCGQVCMVESLQVMLLLR